MEYRCGVFMFQDGETPLYCAANMARIDNAMVLVQAGADINALNNVSILTQENIFYF